MERVVVTGMGVVSCLGHELGEVAANLRAVKSGIVTDPARVELGFRSPLTGAIPAFDDRALLSRKERRALTDAALFGAVAALRALDDAHLSREAVARPEVGVVLGNDSTAAPVWEALSQTVAEKSTRNLGGSAVVRCMNSSPSMNLSVLLGTRGANWTLSAACASGAHAVGQAYALIAAGLQDVVICGGVQELGWEGMAAFDGQGTFSQQGPRPFSRERDGLVPGGGGAVLVLESLAHARARDARIRAELRGYAFSSDGAHLTAPTGEGAARAMRDALARAGVSPGEIEYVNAHATATPLGDAAEARALLAVFGDTQPPVSSTKGVTGHECWMAGASELVYSLLMAEHGFLAPNAGFSSADDGFERLDLLREVRETRARTLLSNSFGFGGTNAAIVLSTEVP